MLSVKRPIPIAVAITVPIHQPKIAALAILAAPHLIGAPHPFLFESNVPAELSAQFAVASLVTSAFFWLVLGTTSGYFYKKLVQETSGDFLKNTSTLKPQ